MLIHVQWYDKMRRTALCKIEGVWSYPGFNQAYIQLIFLARQVDDRINIIYDISQATSLDMTETTLLRVAPFTRQAVVVTQNIHHPVVTRFENILYQQTPMLMLSHAPDVRHAMNHIQGALVPAASG